MPEINHEILTWARETSGLTVEDAAKKLLLKDTQAATGADKLLAMDATLVCLLNKELLMADPITCFVDMLSLHLLRLSQYPAPNIPLS